MPLAGRTVVVTRAAEQGGELTHALAQRGARVLEVPTIQVLPPLDPRPLEEALGRGEDYALMLLGSQNAVAGVRAALLRLGRRWPGLIACVGEKTRAAALDLGPGPVVAAAAQRAEGLVETVQTLLGARLAGARLLFPRGEHGREHLLEALLALGARLDAPLAYRVQTAPPPPAERRAELAGADAFTFLSGETLARFLEIFGEAGRGWLLAARVAVIGPVARARAEALGVRVDLVPPAPSVEALAQALDEAF